VAEEIRQHPGRDQPTPGDGEQDVVLAADLFRKLPDEPLEVWPADDVPLRGRHAVDGFVFQKNSSATTM
jgi:hypothetical protein